MNVLVPIDGSDCSFRALEFATEFAKRYDGRLHVVHITDHHGRETDAVLEDARDLLEEADVADDPEVVIDLGMSKPKYADRVGKDILERVENEGYDHVVMGHHGTGRIGRALLGSAAETVVRAAEVPSTVVP
ncbi:MAG: universal stress protein [Haloarculaceae archaeon]